MTEFESTVPVLDKQMANPPDPCSRLTAALVRLRSGVDGKSKDEGVKDFEESEGRQSQLAKAASVRETMTERGIPFDHCLFVSLGGAGGTELESLLSETPAKYGILLEYDDANTEKARLKADHLKQQGKVMDIFTGDVADKVGKAVQRILELKDSTKLTTVVVTIHAVLHELPNRSKVGRDLLRLLSEFLFDDINTLVIAREPAFPKIPAQVILKTRCSPRDVRKLAQSVRAEHVEFQTEDSPVLTSDGVRMSSHLAVEVLTKLFYIDAVGYEIDERVTAFTQEELLRDFENVFEPNNVTHSEGQTGSFDRLWREWGIELLDPNTGGRVPRPSLHMRIVAEHRVPRPTVEEPGRLLRADPEKADALEPESPSTVGWVLAASVADTKARLRQYASGVPDMGNDCDRALVSLEMMSAEGLTEFGQEYQAALGKSRTAEQAVLRTFLSRHSIVVDFWQCFEDVESLTLNQANRCMQQLSAGDERCSRRWIEWIHSAGLIRWAENRDGKRVLERT